MLRIALLFVVMAARYWPAVNASGIDACPGKIAIPVVGVTTTLLEPSNTYAGFVPRFVTMIASPEPGTATLLLVVLAASCA